MKRTRTIILLTLLATTGFAQSSFLRVLGHPGWDDLGRDLAVSPTGDIFITGYASNSSNSERYLSLFRLDQNGNTLQTAMMDHADLVTGERIKLLPTGELLLGFNRSPLLTKQLNGYARMTSNFGLAWESYAGAMSGTYDEQLHGLAVTDSGFAFFGSANGVGPGGADMHLVEVDALTGMPRWNIVIGGTGSEIARDGVYTTDSSFVMAGFTTSFGAASFDIYLVEVDRQRMLRRTRIFRGSNIDEARSILQASDGGFYLAGRTRSYGAGGTDAILMKTDRQFNLQWFRTYGGSNHEEFLRIQLLPGDKVIATGYTASYGAGGRDALLVQLDANGAVEWAKAYGDSGQDWGFGVVRTPGGGFTVTGRTDSPTWTSGRYDMMVFQTTPTGEIENGCYQSINMGTASHTIPIDSGGITNDTLRILNAAFTNISYTYTASTPCPIVLPISPLVLNGADRNGSFQLDWTSDLPFVHSFAVETDVSGAGFRPIHTVQSPDSPGQFSHLLPDLPLQGQRFRIAAIDQDGQLHHSNSITYSGNGAPDLITVFPNPAQARFGIDFHGRVRSGKMELYSMLGQLLRREEFSQATALNYESHLLTEGLYIIRLRFDDGRIFHQTLRKSTH